MERAEPQVELSYGLNKKWISRCGLKGKTVETRQNEANG